MAGKIKGITIEFQADATKLNEKLREISKDTAKIDAELKKINKGLKFNPTSVEHWRQKQDLLNKKIDETKKKLQILKDEQKAMTAAGVEKNSEEYRRLQREITETESKLRSFKSQLVEVGNANLKALSEGFKQVGEKMTEAGKTLTTKVTLPLSLIGGAAAKNFAEVDKIMVLTNSTMANTEEQAKQLNNAMKEAAANSTYGMTDAANATLNFARAGLTAEQAAAALAPAMNLAAGEGGNLDTVSSGLVATINGFHGSFDEAARYADIFANACNNSALDVDSLSSAMSVAAPIFAAAGYSVEDAALYMGVMANNGIEADKAANSLKTGLARLVSPAKDGATAMNNLGISITNADGTMKDTVTIQKELHDAFANLSEAEQIAAASAIFGKNQMSPWLALINTAPESVEALSESIISEGTATQMASDMMSGFGGTIEQLKSSIDVAAVSLGEALAPMIQVVVDWIQKAVDWFNSLDDKTKTVIATIGVVVAALGPVLVILGSLFSAIGTVIGAIGSFGTVLSLITGPVGIAIAAIAAVIAIGIALYKNWDTIKGKALEVKNWVVEKWTALRDGVVNTVNSLKEKVLALWNALKSAMETILNAISGKVAAVWNAIKFAITHPIEAAVTVVKAALDKIKGFFSGLKLELPHIKLPHFNLVGSFSLNPPSVPHLSIDWYKNGGIFTNPTVFQGVGVGEAGAEAVLPLNRLWEEMDKRFNAQGIVVNVYGSDNMSVDELAEKVEQKLIELQKRKVTAWA